MKLRGPLAPSSGNNGRDLVPNTLPPMATRVADVLAHNLRLPQLRNKIAEKSLADGRPHARRGSD